MKQGALIFDELTDRYDIRFDLADYYGGLHCGDCLEVFTGGKWKPTRMEYGDNWYLVCSSASERATDTLDKKIKKLIRKDMEQNAGNARK